MLDINELIIIYIILNYQINKWVIRVVLCFQVINWVKFEFFISNLFIIRIVNIKEYLLLIQLKHEPLSN